MEQEKRNGNMKYMILLLVAISPHGKAQNSDGYTDENRPYKFGFNIEGYQHRSEEKDEKGIIKGEYGFVTGDGVYHVTVYATDENGNFRIISMKNFYIGLPNEPTTTAPQRSTTSPATQKPSTIRKLEGIQGCGGCLVPTSTIKPGFTESNDQIYDIDIRFKNDDRDLKKKFSTESPKFEPSTQRNFLPKATTSSQLDKILTTYKPRSYTPATILPNTGKILGSKNSPGRYKENNVVSTPMLTVDPKGSDKPQMIKTPDFQTNSLQSVDPSGVVYEFNQTQTYQGHHEKGFLDGSKQGDYFVNGRDGVQQYIEYTANESGYQPHIRFQNISASETPHPDTEKLNNVLKGFYFKWFYKK